MGMIEFLSRTLSQTFQVGGASGPQVKNNAGKLEVVDSAGSTTQAIVATPSADGHAATKAYVDGLVGNQGKVLEIAVPFDFNDAVAEGSGTVTSTAELPIGAVVQSTDLKVSTAFDGGVTVKVGTTADDDAFMLAAHNDPLTPGTYSHDDRAAGLGSASVVQVTLDASGTPAQGAGTVYVSYSLPLS